MDGPTRHRKHQTSPIPSSRLPPPPNRHTHHRRIPHKRRINSTHPLHPKPNHPQNPPLARNTPVTNPLNNLTPKQPNQTNPNDTHTTDWRNNANCTGKTNQMFPKNYKDITYIPQARKLCRTCPVKTQCLEYALEFPAADMHGVWAGLTPRQLAAEQRRRGVRPSRPTLAQLWSGRG